MKCQILFSGKNKKKYKASAWEGNVWIVCKIVFTLSFQTISLVCLVYYLFRYVGHKIIEDSPEYKGIVYGGFVLYGFMIVASLIIIPGVQLVSTALTVVTTIVSEARRKSMRKVYDAKWKVLTSWANQRKIDAFKAPPNVIADYLIYLFNCSRKQRSPRACISMHCMQSERIFILHYTPF